ncbi:MAG: hypothetical protein UU67_C0063G0007 [Candidatus Daviesbacteria bacterium GW2011_GWB1_41_5]|uniref:Uncharacterized protein n=1 Tax=Candidatus Daviesbacteria bacterium GW2011_GWB1_41_5 TaxID=1618429 RepID=A0A0G0YQ78_9BACT|nr:MAG: hypothetical protein UU67_C0063G0007 [Candidatus Daviesbacteria bacterium GW2011_GWB1_41_5]
MHRQNGGLIVDLGNVIIAYWLSNITPENFHTTDYNVIPEVPGVFESLGHFNKHFNDNVTVVYKATEVAKGKVFGWLVSHKFSERTGIPLDRVAHSVSGRDKTSHIGQSSETHYGTTIVVDDRLEVLSYFVGKVQNLFLFRPQLQEIERFRHTGALAHVRIVQTWQEIEDTLGI